MTTRCAPVHRKGLHLGDVALPWSTLSWSSISLDRSPSRQLCKSLLQKPAHDRRAALKNARSSFQSYCYLGGESINQDKDILVPM